MFKLIVILFAVSNGVTSEQPSGSFQNNKVFHTEKACMEFLESEPGKKSKLLLEELVEDQKGKLELKVFCVQDWALKQDDSI